MGFIRIEGGGLKRLTNDQRYRSLNELAALPSPRKVVEKASVFEIQRGQDIETLDGQQFEQESEQFRQKAGI